jgi:hypothetical protein
MENIVKNLDNENMDRLHGIIMIDDSIEDESVLRYDGQGISDNGLMNAIRNEIWKAYLKWKIIVPCLVFQN